jgi:predicted PhzF superfamily epimerase YddE/YHI9
MRLPYYHVDAFTNNVFSGNPAGVCPLELWLPDGILQSVAAENNLSETAFFKRAGDLFELRWFTPTIEVDLCGHATLAPAHVLFAELGYSDKVVRFQTRAGLLTATRRNGMIELDFPARPPLPCTTPENLVRGLGREPRETLKSRDYLAVFGSQAEVAALMPQMDLLGQLDCLGIIATAPGDDSDFVSRFFAPQAGVPEDPVTGSSHSSLIPFWAERLGKRELFARQISRRGGEIFCRHLGDRVGIGGRAIVYGRGEIEVPATGCGL